MPVHIARKHLLPGPRLAADQQGAVTGRKPARQRQYILHRRVLRHRRLIVLALRGREALQQVEQYLRLEGLEQVIGGAIAHRLHRVRHRAMRGDHDEGQVGVPGADIPKQVPAVHAVHLHIADHKIDRDLFQLRQRLDAVAGRARPVAAELDSIAQRFTQCGVILDDEYTHTVIASLRRQPALSPRHIFPPLPRWAASQQIRHRPALAAPAECCRRGRRSCARRRRVPGPCRHCAW